MLHDAGYGAASAFGDHADADREAHLKMIGS
jgi:hypothetical protein